MPDGAPPVRGTGLPGGSLLGALGRYRVERALGKGVFGEAYLAHDMHLDRPCVVKRMTVDMYWSADDQQRAQGNFQREARLLVTLNTPGHPNIPEIYEYLPEQHCLVMKYISGHNLGQVLHQQGGALPLEAALRYVRDVCSALIYMHSRVPEPVLHRDIKPDNILLDTAGRVWLVDFGLAKAAPQRAELARMDTTSLAGTLGFTPPEQWAGRSEPRSDVYALAATLHLLLTGYQPSRTELLAMIHGAGAGLPPVRQFNQDVPAAIELLIGRALALQPRERPSAQEFFDLVEAALAAPALPPPPRPTLPPQVQGFVGRVAERSALQATLQTQGAAVLAGPMGVGKTSLAAQLAGSFERAERLFWHTLRPDESPERVFWSLAAHLASEGFDQVWQLLHQPVQSGSLPAKTLVADYLVDLLVGKDYLLILDDAHLGEDDAAFSYFARRLHEAAQNEGLQLLVTVRRVPAWAPAAIVQTLAGLTIEETLALLETQSVQLNEQLAATLYAHTEGNPKFLLLACNAFQRGDEPAQLVTALAHASDVAEYLLAEVHRLLNDNEQVLMSTLGVLLGVPASRDAIEYLLDADDLWDQLNLLSRSYLLSATTGPQGVRYSQHALVQQFYYGRLGLRRRVGLHRRAAEFYEHEERDLLLAARHYALAGEAERGATMLLADIRALINRGAASDLALVLQALPSERLSLAAQVGVLTGRGELALLQAEYADTRALLEQALSLSGALDPGPGWVAEEARRYRLLAQVELRTGHYARAEELCQQGIALATAPGQSPNELLLLQAQLADVLLRQGELERAEAACEAGLALLPPAPAAPRERVLLMQRLATLAGNRGRFAEAVQQLEATLLLARRVGEPLLLSVVLNNLGNYLHYSAAYERALVCYDESLRLKEQVGDVRGRIETMMNMSLVHQALGATAAALERYRDAYQFGRRIGAPDLIAVAALNSGRIQFEQGALALAEAAVAEAEQIFRQLGDHDGLADSLCALGDVALARREPENALQRGTQALHLAQQIGNRAFEASALRVIGEAHIITDDYASAEAALATAWHIQTEIADPYDQALLLTAQARLSAASGARQRASELASRALQMAHEQGILHIVSELEALLQPVA